MVKDKQVVRMYQEKIEEDGEISYRVSKIEYPDGYVEEFNEGEEEIDMSYMKNYEGERVEVYSRGKVVLSGIISNYKEKFENVDSGGVEIDVDKDIRE